MGENQQPAPLDGVSCPARRHSHAILMQPTWSWDPTAFESFNTAGAIGTFMSWWNLAAQLWTVKCNPVGLQAPSSIDP